MGGSSSQTIGYRYRYALQWGLTFGPVDALLRWVAGGREAWRGRITDSASVVVSDTELWGGDSKEGGIDGTLRVNMGGPTQMPDTKLATIMNHPQPAYRGKLTAWFEGVFGAMNPYPKKSEFLVERILSGWEGDSPWYPEKAIISVPSTDSSPPVYKTFDALKASPDGAVDNFVFETHSDSVVTVEITSTAPTSWSRWDADSKPAAGGYPWMCSLAVVAGGVFTEHLSTHYVTAEAAYAAAQLAPVNLTGFDSYKFFLSDNAAADNRGGITIKVTSANALRAMNPAHMIYDSITDRRENGGQGEPRAAINDASFRAAADKLHEEGFGLCTVQGDSESAEEFQERILNVIGASLTQSRVDGLYYLDLIRSDYVLADLPIISDDDILEIDKESSSQLEMINRVQVNWLDVDQNQSRITSPVTSLGLVQAVGGVISKTYDHREIPTEAIALRVAQRYLTAQPSSKFSLKTNRRSYALRKGRYFRLQCLREGIADMVCIAGEIDYGELSSGSISIKALPDVFGLPASAFIEPATAIGSGNSGPAKPAPAGTGIELPYVEVVSMLPRERLTTLSPDVGYFGLVAERPSSDAINFSLWTAAASAPVVDVGQRDWCPKGVTATSLGRYAKSVTLESLVDASRVRVGGWAMIGQEIVRVDAISDLVLTIARGCGDTVPASHAPGTAVWFAGDWVATDLVEYVGGDVVTGKAQTRAPGSVLPLAASFTAATAMNDRFGRPYPAGNLKGNGELDPVILFGDVALTWAHRDRILQGDTLVDATAADIGPETGVTYTVRAIDLATSSEVSSTSVSGNSHTLSGSGLPIQCRIEVIAVRGGVQNLQPAWIEFQHSSTDARITETGEYRTTEAGDIRILE